MTHQITRHYVDVAGRRVHYRRSGKGPPVVMLHQSPRSGAALLPLMGYGPQGVTMLAFDTPGCGDSDPLDMPRPEAADYGDAMNATLQALGITRCVVYGTHTGAATAMALAVQHPTRVSRLVIDGLGAFDAAERAQLLDTYLPPFVPVIDGTHLAWLWARLRDQYLFFPWNHRGTGARLWLPLPEPGFMHNSVLDFLRAGDNYRAPYAAAFRFQPALWLHRLRMPVFIGVRTDDMLLPHLQRLGEVPGNARVETLSADQPKWAATLWAQMQEGTEGLADAPLPLQASLPAGRIANAYASPESGGLHLRGSLAGADRPLLLLHDSPGGARGLDRQLQALLGQRPVLAPDLPGHGDSPEVAGVDNAQGTAGLLHETLLGLGIPGADVQGVGASAGIAAALAQMYPRSYACANDQALPAAGVAAPGPFTPRADGGHLAAAWFHARDEAILGPWWQRHAGSRHDFGDDLDLPTIHARTVEILKEQPQAAFLRAAWLAEAAGR